MLHKDWEHEASKKQNIFTIDEPYTIYLIGVEDFQKRAIEVLSNQNWNNEDERVACIEILKNLKPSD
jgi:hypothetical protein